MSSGSWTTGYKMQTQLSERLQFINNRNSKEFITVNATWRINNYKLQRKYFFTTSNDNQCT